MLCTTLQSYCLHRKYRVTYITNVRINIQFTVKYISICIIEFASRLANLNGNDETGKDCLARIHAYTYNMSGSRYNVIHIYLTLLK